MWWAEYEQDVNVALHDIFLLSNLELLSMNFLVSGHSQNENDSAHSNIEQTVRLCTLYTPEQWKAAMQMAFKPGKVIINTLRYNEVIDIKDKWFFPEYTSILEDTTTEEDLKVKNRKTPKCTGAKFSNTNVFSSLTTAVRVINLQLFTRN